MFFKNRKNHKPYDYQGYDWRAIDPGMGLRLVFNHHLPGDKALALDEVMRIAYRHFYGTDPRESLIEKELSSRGIQGGADPQWLTHYHRYVIEQIDEGKYEFLEVLTRYGILIA